MKFPHIPRECHEVTTPAGEFVILRYGIISTPWVEYRCYERAPAQAFTHSTYTFEAGVKLGLVQSRALPAELAEMEPGSMERILAVEAWRDELAQVCVEAITAAFPDVMEREGARTDGANVYTAENTGEAVAA